MHPRLIAAVACATLVAVLAGTALSASAAPAATTANSVTFEDSRGEMPNAPDITTVVVSNTDAGVISFRINGPSQLVEGMLVEILVDADSNPATGDPEILGADYAIELFRGTANLFRWDGTNFTRRPNDPPQSSLIFQELTIRINAAELGNTARFNFGVTVITGIRTDANGDPDFSATQFDAAPDVGHGFWSYNVRIAPLRLLARSFSLSPRRPLAGRTLTARLVAARSDTGAVLSGGRVVCTATVGGRRLTARGRFVGTQARCAWQVPSSARGQRLRGSIAVVFEGKRVTRSFAAPVG
jgi:hypothetical protein